MTTPKQKEQSVESGEQLLKDLLEQHPETLAAFLADHPELIKSVQPEAEDRKDVVHFHRAAVAKLKNDLNHIADREADLIAVARSNHQVQSIIHDAVLTLLEARSFEHLIHSLTNDLTDQLDLAAICLFIDGREGGEQGLVEGVTILPPGTVDRLTPADDPVRMDNTPTARRLKALYGPAADLIASDALVRLDLGPNMPAGLLALGARDEGHFTPGHGTELLRFLAGATERLIKAWADLQ